MRPRRVVLGQLLDEGNHNAQVANAVSILEHCPRGSFAWRVPYYERPAMRLHDRPDVRFTRLVRGTLWRAHKALFYQKSADLLFYPGPYWFDALGLGLRRWTGRRVPVVATLEGLAGNPNWESIYSDWAGHPVYCQRSQTFVLRSLDYVYRVADHIVAISPFLAALGRRRYGDKFSVIPLGIEDGVFHARGRRSGAVPLVVAAGRVAPHKRPEVFVDLARRHRDVKFCWYGDGESRAALVAAARSDGLDNLEFPGLLPPAALADVFRSADVFVMPSQAEGVPKVTQEAAACGLPVVLFGFYEAPSVADNVNGYVVWNDDDFAERVAQLLDDATRRRQMGEAGAERAQAWSWTNVAHSWHERLLALSS